MIKVIGNRSISIFKNIYMLILAMEFIPSVPKNITLI
jgi:hypothetical protein